MNAKAWRAAALTILEESFVEESFVHLNVQDDLCTELGAQSNILLSYLEQLSAVRSPLQAPILSKACSANSSRVRCSMAHEEALPQKAPQYGTRCIKCYCHERGALGFYLE